MNNELRYFTRKKKKKNSHTAMELLRHSAALALNKSLDQVLFPYDLLALMDITTLWSNMSNKLPSMVSEV